MKKIYISTLILLAVVTRGDPVYSQICDSITPVFNVNLTGQPNGTWISPTIVRDGYCCGVTGSDKCIEFIITLDSSANGINFSIASGAVPPGALFYQINCGPPVAVGQPICLNGPGPHLLTFCKPGNNNNTYQITSIPQPALNGTQWVSQACTGNMNVTGLEDTSITWTSIPYNATYNSFLSCTNGCNAVTVNPSGTALPAYVDYQVCGYVTAACLSVYFCDTIRINFVNNLAVAITPQNPIICFGGPNATVTANPSGGLAPFNYLWSNGATSQSITVGAGIYTVQLQDSMSCSLTYDTVIVTALPSPIAANAGTDQLMCTNQQSVNLNGSVNVASGGIWLGGSGIFSPDNITLNANYTPSANELISGNLQLMLVTTGNYSCPADTDVIVITISQNPIPSVSGNMSICENSTQVYTAPLVSNINYLWSVTGGNIITLNSNSITVQWGNAGSGTIMLTETNPLGCDSSITIPVIINPNPTPVINGPQTVCTTTLSQHTVANPVSGNSYNWSITGGTISGASNNNSVNIQWNTPGNATITVTETNSYGCDSTVMIPVTILTMPTPVISGPANVCEFQTITYSTPYVSGNTYNWNVTGGNIISNNNNSITVNWPSAGNGTITLTEANTLVCDSIVTLNVIIGPQPVPVINGPQSVCTTTISQYTVANPVAGNSYNWSVTGGSISGASNNSSVNVQWNTAGNATVTVTAANTYGCDSTVMIPVTILTMPVPVISGPVNVCEFQTLIYSTPYVAGNTYNWNVTGGTIIANNNNSITVNWPAAGSGTVTVTEANTLVCDSTVTLNIIIGPQPVPVINGPQTVCTTTISQYAVANPIGGNSYNWSVTGGVISGSSNNSTVNVQWFTAGNATITVTQANSYGCDSTVMIPVTILTIPVPVISGPLNVCEFQTLIYSTPYVAGNTYTWNVTGGTIIANNNNSITVNWPAAGSGTVTVTEANTLVCDSTVTLNIVIGPQPVPVINGPQTVCTTTISQYAVTNPIGGNSYNWSVTGGVISGSSNNSTVNVQWFTAGNATITVTQANSFGCDSTVMIPVTILTMPVPVISGPLNVCEFQTLTYSTPFVPGNTYNWNVTGGTIISNNNNSITVNWPAAGNGTVTLTEANTLTCDSTVAINVIIGPQPVPVINGPQTVCTTTISQYAVANPIGGNSYNWTVTGGTISGASNNNSVYVQWSNAGNATITVTESNSYGCDSTVSIPVTVLTMPVPVISGLLNVCEFQTLTYSTPFVPGNTYTWNVTGGTIVTNNNNSITVNWPAAGNGTVTLTEANTLTCDSTVAINVIIGPQPIPVINGPQSVCTTTISQYAVANPIGGNSYNWTVTGGTISGASNNNSVYVQWSNAGNATITVTESNSYGCDSTVSIPVTVLMMPVPVISGPMNVCEFQILTYTTPFVSGNTYNWNVLGGTIIANNTNSITVNWTAAGTGTVTLTEANTLTCDSTVTINVFIGPQPVPVINGPALICTSTYAQYAVTNPVAGDSYNWAITGGTIIGSASTDNITVLWTTAGAGIVTVTESNNFGCDSLVSYPVDVKLKPAPFLNGTPVACESDTSIYAVQNVIGHTYIWNVTGGSIVGLTVGSSIEVLWTSSGNGSVVLRQISPDGCDSIVSKSVYINPLPQPIISGPVIICEDELSSYNVTNVNSNTYYWTASPGNINGSSSTSIVNVVWPNPGLGILTVVETTPQGCDRKTDIIIAINEKPQPSISGSNVGCISNALSNYSSVYQPGINYQWNISGGNIVSGNGTSTIAIQWVIPGWHTVSVTAVNPLTGCDSILTVLVHADSLAQPVIQTTGLTGCVPVKLDFSGNSMNPNYSYSWNFGDGTYDYSSNPSHTYAEPGTYAVQLIAVNNTGCADTVTAEVQAYPIPEADFNLWYGTGPYIVNLSTLEISNHSIGATTYSWDLGDGNTSSLFEPQYNYKTPGTYLITLTVSNQWNCTNSTAREIIVKVPENIFIPNAFSPNNDHVNDYFKVAHKNITEISVSVFDRWGERIYSSEDPYFKWDGTFQNKPVQEGVYVYLIRAKGYHGKSFNLTGDLTLIR